MADIAFQSNKWETDGGEVTEGVHKRYNGGAERVLRWYRRSTDILLYRPRYILRKRYELSIPHSNLASALYFHYLLDFHKVLCVRKITMEPLYLSEERN